MATQVRSVDFLPEIFQTPVNKQFLSATLDQLIQEPQYRQTQGYIGQRVGPGVNPADNYVVEPTNVRNDYQLEPGVVILDPESLKVTDAITYPGILDAIRTQGGFVNKADRLFESEYYAWDPFVDLDKFTNYAQYYWLPNGPETVTVSATQVPTEQTFTVTRANGAYTFSGVAGNNPMLTLVRNGQYEFKIAQNTANSIDFRVENNTTTAWVINYVANPTLTLERGSSYTFNLNQTLPLAFYIKTEESYGTTNLWNLGVTNNGATTGLVTFTVPYTAPDTLYYANDLEFNLRGTLNIVDPDPGTGPDFWIQAAPGVNGRLPWSQNISSRPVLGVTNNGTDLGTVNFDVPAANAQEFFYTMPNLGTVNLLVGPDIKFNQLNGISVAQFKAQFPTGIDGITEINNRTLVFTTPVTDPVSGGWQQQNLVSSFDPLVRTTGTVTSQQVSYDVNGEPYDDVPYETISTQITGTPSLQDGELGSYDSLPFDQTTNITVQAEQYQIWQIQYVLSDSGVQFIQLNPYELVPNLSQFTINYGTDYVNTRWYKNAAGFFQQMPLLTALSEYVYYQDGEDPAMFGVIKLIDQDLNATINVTEDILGKKNYTSPNGVTFTNGLKIIFQGNVIPESYQNETYYVAGVGSGIKLLSVNEFITPENFAGAAITPYNALPYSYGPYNSSTSLPTSADYITISQASPDLNAWSRSNRWFHTDVIQATATYNNTSPSVSGEFRAKRPIIEFRAGLKLFNFGSDGIPAVNVIDFAQSNALLNVNGQTGYGIDGYELTQGDTVIFAADIDPNVRNQIYKINFVVLDPENNSTPVIDLEPVSYSPALPNQVTVCVNGLTQTGQSYYYTGTEWLLGQQKTSINQPPLFDVYDSRGYSFGDLAVYPSSNFLGCKLLSYAEDITNEIDSVLKIPLAYASLDNIGDILFTNNLYTDTFVYTPTGKGLTVDVSTGFVRQYVDRTTFELQIGWQTAAIPSLPRQQFRFVNDGTPLLFDIVAETALDVPPVQIFVNGIYQLPSSYSITIATQTNTTSINLDASVPLGAVIEALVYSSQTSQLGFYEVPINLENNPFNENSRQFSLGAIRSHYGTVCENLLDFNGVINGPNNTRDLGNILPYGQQILQQSAPMTLGGYFLRDANYDVFAAIEFNSREYIKYKSKLLNAVTQLDIRPNQTVPEILDASIAYITQNLTSNNSFYWSDMLPAGTNYTSTVTTVNPITRETFNTTQTYDFTKSNYLGLLVYLNGRLLLRGTEYVVSTDSPRLTILLPLVNGDVVTINEYATTVPNWCPNTPSKMGLYSKYKPEIFLDESYSSPAVVIRGHDGSITIAFNDIRDQVLLEFEKRIYNNIKVDNNPIPLTTDQVTPLFYPEQSSALLPGYFRSTPYSYEEINSILSESFLTWVGQNKLDYTEQNYVASNPFTYNYMGSANRINQQKLLQGNWRGLYRYFYDTETPNTTPWQMVGFSEMPLWWEQRYGPAPYTSGNRVLWDDLEAGVVGDINGPYVLPEYRRPGLTKIIPAGVEGELLPPTESLVGLTDPSSYQKSWVAGDGGPVQASWWKSSSFPFAIMRMLALTKPAEFFSVFADRDLYRYDTTLGQYLLNGRYRLNASGVQVYGNGVSKASYINWIVDYKQQSGVNATTALTENLASLDVRLCYRMAAFTDPVYIKLLAERAGAGSTNNSLEIPPSSYNLMFYKNQPFGSVTYSAVIVEVVELDNGGQGFTVFGYSNVKPYFDILVSSPVGIYNTITSGGVSVQVPAQYTTVTAQIPYGYTFTTLASVCDFLLSYGAYLETQGLTFNNIFNNYELSWNQMCQEFLYFATQGWTPGTIINLNPCATKITASRPISIVDTIASVTPENMLLDQNRKAIDVSTMVVNREGNEFSITSTTNQTINYLTLKFTNYEDMIILDNTSQYNDLIYDPVTAARQSRLNLTASITIDWDGQLNAQGFILNLNNVKQWQAYTKYTKGEMVLFKNTYWQALTISEPQATFNYAEWAKTDYQAIQSGLLPNLANKAEQLVDTYNVYQANLTSDNDLFAFGLIGFRPRQYMSDMNLNEVAQVQLYQQFLGTKGTREAAQILSNAKLAKESGAYDIYENWGVLSGTYGAQANKSFFELQLDEGKLSFNPSTVQVVEPGQASQANQQIFVSDLWRESYNITSANILPTVYNDVGTATALPSAGYVSLDDVDITVFSIDDPSAIAANIDTVGIGTYIWIAKINSYDWGIYRANKVEPLLTTLSDNLNGSSVAQFNNPHNLNVADLIIIRYFDPAVDGVYRVLSTPTPTTLTIAYTFTNTNSSSITGSGLVFRLESARVNQASDIANLSFVDSLLPGARVWIDKDADGHWQTVEKQAPFVSGTLLNAGSLPVDEFSTSIAQTADTRGAIIGSPGNNTVFAYYQDEQLNYQVGQTIVLNAVGAANFGSVVAFGNTNWAVATANESLSGIGYAVIIYRNSLTAAYSTTQILLPPDQNFTAIGFGSSATISKDERWMYIGAPAANTVYAYERVNVESQSVSYITDGFTNQYNYSNSIQINYLYPGQLVVTIGTRTAIYGIDYTINQTSVIFGTPQANNQEIIITRTETTALDQRVYYGIQPNSTTGIGTGAVFTVNFVRGIYGVVLESGGVDYSVGDVLVINGAQLGGITGVNDLVITVTVELNNVITGFTSAGVGNFSTTTFSLNQVLYNATTISNFTVEVNGQLQRPYYDYTFDPVTTILTFLSGSVPGLGADITVFTPTYWQYVSNITAASSLSGDNFGASVSTTTDGRQLIIGAPDASANLLNQAGTVYSFDRSVIRYIVSNPTQMTYAIPGAYSAPIAVSVNRVFLLTEAQSITGQFTVVANNIVFANITFDYGDIIEIETNQFQQLQQFISVTPTDQAFYGYATDTCPLNCSVYIGAPRNTITVPQEGTVEQLVNQSRVYGVITSTIANPTLQVGATIRINDSLVAVPGLPNNTPAGFATAINTAAIPNVVATTTPDLTFIGDGIEQVYNIGSMYEAASSYTTLVYIDNALQQAGTQYSYDPSTTSIYFVNPPVISSVIQVISGRLTLSVKNANAASPQSKITVLPGTDTIVFEQLGFETFVLAQQITSPASTMNGQFGSSISIDSSAVNLIVGSPNGNIYEPTTFDSGKTYFDDRSTIFFNPINSSGVAYTYDYFESYNASITNPGKFVFGQQIYADAAQTGDKFGVAVNYVNGKLIVGSPGSVGLGTLGFAAVFDNMSNTPSWKPIRYQQPVVDVYQLDGVFSYSGSQASGINDNLASRSQTFFDFFDPLQGKILGVARQNIDYIGAVDPGQYNTGPVRNNGNVWGLEHIGQIWWDTDTVRFIDPNQDDIVYASRRWGSIFPGSSVDVYQWIESTSPPASYTGPGIPLSTISYTVGSKLGLNNVFTTLYYFWVRGITTISTTAGKTLSANGVASYIADPRSSGLPYIAGLNASTIAIYNAQGLISGTNTILSIGFDRKLTDDVVHQQYQIITDGIADSFLNANLYRKLQDSLCGIDTAGNAVPDPKLSLGMRYGVQFRPRQSMFANRFKALENYFTRANSVLIQYPISESRNFDLLNASQPVPVARSGAWNFEVPNLEILAFQNLATAPVGYKYLVSSDSSQQGRWTIYEVTQAKILMLIQIQNYDTPLYWYYVNWYLPGYNSTVAPVAAVQNYGQLSTLSYTTVPVGASVRVINNGANKFEIYLRTGIDPVKDWTRVGLEDGTIQISEQLWDYNLGSFGFDSQVFDSQYYDQTPQTETRFVIQALNEQIYIEDLEIERNSSLILMFNYVYSEFVNPEWLIKTSYVNVNHNIRSLEPYQIYNEDNQEFVLNYFQEVKPYHVQVRQFNLVYDAQDNVSLDATDYDLPAYYNNLLEVPQFVSPILTPYTYALTTNRSDVSDTPADSQLWLAPSLYSQWYNNYLLSIQSVVVVNGGTGYTIPPVVTVTGDCIEQARMSAIVNSTGQVVAVLVDYPGLGYTSTAVISIFGGNGTGAVAVSVMGNQQVRSIRTTIKYDRYQYQTTLVEWTSGETYAQGTQVRYLNEVWQAIAAVTNTVFDPAQWLSVDANTLSGVDRTMGYYIGTATTPGLSLPLLIDGIDYPGVQVEGLNFDMDTGFDRGPYDMTPFENLNISAEGYPTYDLGLLDTVFESSYLDSFLGTRAEDILINGGAYVDTYSSHAPEELVPGAVFDTLDFRVYTTPGADWDGLGHGFAQELNRVTYTTATATFSFARQVPYPFAVELTDETQGYELILGVDYTVNWPQQTVTLLSTSGRVVNNDTIDIYVYGLGGGNQLYKQTYNGASVGNRLIVPIEYNLVYEFAIFVNGVPTTDFTYASNASVTYGTTVITFADTYTNTDFISLVAIGPTTVNGVTTNYSWSTPLTQVIPAVTGTNTYALANSLIYTNPATAVVMLAGERIRTAAGVGYSGNSVGTTFLVPQRLGFDQATITQTDVLVYINAVLQTSGYTVQSLATGTTVTFSSAPPAGSRIYIAVTIGAQAVINPANNTVTFIDVTPITGEFIQVTTFNDTREQRLITQVIVGPITIGVSESQGYDTTPFDQGNVNDEPGSYDYSFGDTQTVNNIILNRTILNNTRPWVTLNGRKLSPNIDYVIQGNELVLSDAIGILEVTDVVMVTLMTDTVVPEAMEFRIFQDMRGVQATYRMTPETTTKLTQELSATADVIHVANANALSEPNLLANIWGVITINGERIMYRERDTVLNTVSSLLRGTAGTAVADHPVDTEVFDMGRGNLLDPQSQNYVVETTTLANGSQTVFVAPNITI